MIIDREQLISLLIDKTGLEADQVESQLSELINRIQQAASKGKTFEIEGFGIFSMEEGALQFEPSDTLETEINNKYAGMKPIELIGAFKESGEEVPEVELPEETEDIAARWIFDETAVADESAGPPAEETEDDAEEVYEKIFGTTQQETEPAVPVQEKSLQSEVAESEGDSPKDTLGRFLVAAVVVIALGVGGWVVYDLGFSLDGSEQQRSNTTTQTTQTAALQSDEKPPEVQQSSASQNETGGESEPEQENQVGKNEESPQTTEEPQQNRFGLQGEFNQSAGGYTIVVHSLKSLQKAENNRDIIREAGFRSAVSQAEVRGTTYFRVSIGQFQTVSDAQQALNNLPERYQNNNFIKRIR